MPNDLNIDVPLERVRYVKTKAFGHEPRAVTVRVVRYLDPAGEPAGVALFDVQRPAYARPLAAAYQSGDAELVALAEAAIDGAAPPALVADALGERVGQFDRNCAGAAAHWLRLADETPGYVPPADRVHVRIWYSGTVEFTDLTDAGKRGKTCRTARLTGAMKGYAPGSETEFAATAALIAFAEGLDPAREFDEVWRAALELYRSHFPEGERGAAAHVNHGLVKGVNAPRAELRVTRPGVFAARADSDGVWVEDLADVNNGWTETNRGKNAVAYDKAAKVWGKVREARTFREVVALFEGAGIDLRGYCSVD